MGQDVSDSAGVHQPDAPQPAFGYAPTDSWKAGLSTVRDDRRFALALGAAILLHLLPLVAATGALGVIALPRPSQRAIGADNGKDDGVNVEIIDADEYQRRYTSFTAGHSETDSEAKASAPPLRPTLPAETAKERPLQPPEPSPEREPPPPRKLSQADMAEIMESAKLDMESAMNATAIASVGARGQVSEHVRYVLRRFKQTMPPSKGHRGVVIIGVVLADDGRIAWVGILKSSGNKDLDELVASRVRGTHLDAAQKPLTPDERKIQITYEYQ